MHCSPQQCIGKPDAAEHVLRQFWSMVLGMKVDIVGGDFNQACERGYAIKALEAVLPEFPSVTFRKHWSGQGDCQIRRLPWVQGPPNAELGGGSREGFLAPVVF